MSQNKLSEWAERLESQQTGEAGLDLAASLRANRPPAPPISPEFTRRLQARLAQRAARQAQRPQPGLSWLGAAVGLALVILATVITIRLLPNPPGWISETHPGAMLAPTPTAASTPVSTAISAPPSTSAPAPVSPAGPARLIYPCGTGTICTANPDGKESASLLTLPDKKITLLSTSPNRRYLLLSAEPDEAHQPTLDAQPDIPGVGRLGELYTLDLEGGALARLAERFSSSLDAYTADWMPDGQVIFINENEQQQTAIYRIQPDGSGLTRLTELAPSPTHWQLLPSPDLDHIYWRAGVVEGYTVRMGHYFWAPVGSEQTPTIAWPSLEGSSVGEINLSPAGGQMAYVLHSGTLAVYIANLDGSEARQVWSAPQNDQPTPGLAPRFFWSPDGRSLLLEQYRINSEPETFSVVYALYDLQSGLTSELSQEINVQEAPWPGALRIGLAPQWSPSGGSVLLNHPDYAYPLLLDLQTLTVTRALTNTIQPNGLTWQPVLWLP